MPDPICPIHKTALLIDRSYYGTPWYCPVQGCTVIWWGRKGTVPADKETRETRKRAFRDRRSL